MIRLRHLLAATLTTVSVAGLAAPTTSAANYPDVPSFVPTMTVLGARLNNDCSMPAVLNKRLDAAARYAHTHLNIRTITTGGRTNPACSMTEAQAMAVGLYTRGVFAIVETENNSTSTVGNAAGVRGLGVTSTALVTSASHMARARSNFASVGIATTPVTAPD